MIQNRNSEHPAPLIAAVRSGDEKAFSLLLEQYAPLLSSLVSIYSVGGVSPEEMMQEARFALYRATLSYREGGVTFGLFAKICVRNALIALGRRVRRAELPRLFSELSSVQEQLGADVGEDALDALIHREALEELYGLAVRVLSPYEARVFRLYAGGSLIEEIAAGLSREVKSVRNALDRALAKLRVAYSDVSRPNS